MAPERPAPVTARHVIGKCSGHGFWVSGTGVPDRVPAESPGSIWVLAMSSVEMQLENRVLT
ncbi:MAG: hypothetical protein Ct9H300mP13_1480 [Gammaproteobacteria bacterium]|nr:MAG: hypothetical protein Ct9H300mP13_1480 [Gammaproteobacteria bacterium]